MAKKAPAETSAPSKPITAALRVIVLHGKEAFLRALYTSSVREALTKAFGEFDQKLFDGETATAADVLDECRSFGLLATHKLIIVDNAADLVKEDSRVHFSRYFEAPTESATLLLRGDVWRAGNLGPLIDAVGTTISCEPVDPPKAAAWCMGRCKKRYETTIDPDAATILVERVGVDLGRLDSELAKLSVAAGVSQPITAKLVLEFVGASREEEAWKIQATLLQGNAGDNLTHLRYLLDVSRKNPVQINWSFVDLGRKIHALSRAGQSGVDPSRTARALSLWGGSAGELIDVARSVAPADALALFEACVQADVAQKSGGDPERTLEALAISFGDVLGKGRAATHRRR